MTARADNPSPGLTAAEPDDAHELDRPEAGTAAIRGGAMRAIGYLAGILLSLIAIPLLTRYLGPAQFGRYTTVIALVTIVSGVTEAGLSALGVREYATLEGATRDRWMRSLLGVRLVLVSLGSVAGLAFALAAGYDDVLVAGVAFGGLGLLVATLGDTYAISLTARLRLGWVTMRELVKQVVSTAAVVVLVVGDAGLLPFFIAVLLGTYLADLLFTVPITRGAVPRLPSVGRTAWGAVARDALPFAAATALGIIYFRVTVLVMSLVSTEHETGLFGAPLRIVEVLAGVSYLLVSSAFPILARAAINDRVRLRYALQRMTEVALVVGTWMALCTVIGARWGIEIIAGDEFADSAPVLRIQGVALVATFLAGTWGFTLLSQRRNRPLLIANLAALIVAVTVTLAVAPGHGARGAAFATLGAEIALAASYALALFGRGGERLSLRRVPAVALAAGAAVAAAVLPPFPDVVALIVATVVYGGLVVTTRAVPDEVREALLPRLRRG